MTLYILGIGVAIIILLIIAQRTRLRKIDYGLSERITQIRPYKTDNQEEGTYNITDNPFSGDLTVHLENSFKNKIISSSQEKVFGNYYKEIAEECESHIEKLKWFHIEPSDEIINLYYKFLSLHFFVKKHNDAVADYLLETHKTFFDHCLKYPLDAQQRRSIISEEDNCLVVSSAGSGKTSSIVGRVKYLTEIQKINPEKILLISYTNKAATELTERMNIPGLRGYTFHKLAIDLIGKTTGRKPSICDNTDAIFVNIYHNLLENKKFKKAVLEYFIDYQYSETDWEKQKNERREMLSEQKNMQLKALFPDMDGNEIIVRSEQERRICSALSLLGIKFRYEEAYEHNITDETHAQYRPDFSIYFEKDDKLQRVYLEHYGIDEQGVVPGWFAKEKNISYEEANQKYNDGITWKKCVHEKFKTHLLTTTSADFLHSDIQKKLKTLLSNAGIPIHEKTEKELYETILPKGSKREKAFIRLVATFVTLLKSNCKSVKEILQQTEKGKDERSTFIIQKIFQPIYEHYTAALNDMHQIDFTDAILQATDICMKSNPIEYDHIIVDEFQDISIDRFHFLKALRNGKTPAKLYCVGDDWQSIYRFSGSDMALFNNFPDFFGDTEIHKIETTYRFGEPLVNLSAQFIQRNRVQIKKDIHPFDPLAQTELQFISYDRKEYCRTITQLISNIPSDKSIFLLGRYSFDDYYLSFMYKGIKEGNKYYYLIGNRKIEFLTVHKSKGLEADYVILLQCNKDTYGFPSLVNDDPVLNYVLTQSDQCPFGEERRLFYVAITRAKEKTIVLYDQRFPSVFVDEFLHPEKLSDNPSSKHPNANQRWTRKADQYLLTLHREGKSIKYISQKMGRSQTAIVMRLNKLKASE